MDIQTKRIYEKPANLDGTRILVDRVWPRGISKEDAKLDEWMKEIAPSTELRKWFDHEEERFDDFSKKYKKELEDRSKLVQQLLEKAKEKRLTLLYGAKDEKHNQAIVLKNYLENQ
ncbi:MULTISPECIES: DUF488 domain-containing protein [Aequorivita]|uniref:DUF488 domain-containing protein n=1 Tax=Aequorivita iocasae TaxID=2803865 RepID=A0ABX7DTJ5_9FLAO|nr:MULTISPECIES: DUF488 domain-containing protein [Aequorivita]QQX77127.1 DUF488 domain-containing protein [Aequorivita iocasae]UCA56614.1 DUF488 domain-containing protein [Aequorivita sp. F7]